MLLPARQLLRLPVYTKSGVRLGRLAGFIFEAETQTVIQYEVRRFPWGTPALVHRNQVVSIDADRMVVHDGAIPTARTAKLAFQKPPSEEAASLSTSASE